MLAPFTSLPVMGEIAGANTASLGGYLHSTKTRARWAEGFHELNGYVFDLERDRTPPGCTLPKTHHAMTTHNQTIPDRLPPRSIATAPSAGHQDGGVKCATGAPSKIRGRDNITKRINTSMALDFLFTRAS